MKTEYLPVSINKEFLFDWFHIAQPFFHDTTVLQHLKTVPNNCINISEDFLMGIPDISGHIWKNSINYTEASKDDWIAPFPKIVLVF